MGALWSWHSSKNRAWLLEGEPDLNGVDAHDLAKVAALVRGLCEQDGYPTPTWIEGVRAPTPIWMFTDRPVDTKADHDLSPVPPACHQHDVFYEADMLLPKREQWARLGARMRAQRIQPRRALTPPAAKVDQPVSECRVSDQANDLGLAAPDVEEAERKAREASARELIELATHPSPRVRTVVAIKEATPAWVLAQLVTDPDTEVRICVAQNPSTPPAAAARLAADQNPDVRKHAAAHPNLAPESLTLLAADPSQWVRCPVAEHPNTPPDALERLSDDLSEAVRWRTAEHPNTPPHVLQRLAADPTWQTRIVAAGNPNTPPEVLVGLYRNDPDSDTRHAASHNPNLPDHEPTTPGLLPPRVIDYVTQLADDLVLP